MDVNQSELPILVSAQIFEPAGIERVKKYKMQNTSLSGNLSRNLLRKLLSVKQIIWGVQISVKKCIKIDFSKVTLDGPDGWVKG